MIVENKGNQAVGSLGLKSGTSGIDSEDLHKIIGLLSSQYSDPISSMLREYTSNIHDAYEGLDKDPHGVVSLWKDEEKNQNYLSFRDNGTGMNLDIFENIFVKYGKSTKDKSNVSLGGFGLGSKTAFAYTDAFTIISRYDGVIYTYYYYKGDKGLPAYDLLSKKDTKEENGTEIRIPVKSNDLYTIKKSVKQLAYFDNIYIEGLDYINDFKIIEGNNFKYRKDVNKTMHVCLEKVYYPLPPEFLQYINSLYTDNSYSKPFDDFPFALKFKNGELKPTISRENFEYNEDVKKLLENKVKATIAELKDYYLSKNITEFKKEDYLLDFYKSNYGYNLKFKIDDYDFTIDKKLLDIEFTHDLFKDYYFSENQLRENFKLTHNFNGTKLKNPNKIIDDLNSLKTGYYTEEVIPIRNVKTAFVKETIGYLGIFKSKKPSLAFYKDNLNLKISQKKDWRSKIIAFQACIKNLESNLKNYSTIVPTEDFIEEYKERFKRNKLSEEIKLTWVSDYPYNYKKTETIKPSSLLTDSNFKGKIFVYGDKKDLNRLNKLNMMSTNLKTLNHVRIILVRKMDLDSLSNLSRFIHVKTILNMDSKKLIRKAIKEYQIYLLHREYHTKIYSLTSIYDNLLNEYTKAVKEYEYSISNTKATNLLQSLLDVYPDLMDTEINALHLKLNKYFNQVPLLQFLNHTSEQKIEYKKALIPYLKQNKNKVNTEYYLKINEAEEEWLQEWKKTHDYFKSTNSSNTIVQNSNNLKEIDNLKEINTNVTVEEDLSIMV